MVSYSVFNAAAAGHILDVDDLFFRLTERVRLEVADLLQPVAVIRRNLPAGGRRPSSRARISNKAKEEHHVGHLCHKLGDARHQRECLLVLSVLGEKQTA